MIEEWRVLLAQPFTPVEGLTQSANSILAQSWAIMQVLADTPADDPNWPGLWDALIALEGKYQNERMDW